MFRLSREFIVFLIELLGTLDFWLLFLSSFTAVLMLAWRGSIRDGIYKMAQKSIGRKW
jgi:hypothetical protein